LSVLRLRELARRELVARDPAVADRRRKVAEKLADVTLRHQGDGVAELAALTGAARATAMHDALTAYARLLRADGDARPIGQLRVQALEDLVLRPWDTSRPAVTATLTVFAPLGALTHLAGHDSAAGPPAELGGRPITAAQLRALLEAVDALCPGGLQPPDGGILRYALTDPDGTLRATVDHAELRRLARRGRRDHPTSGCGCAVLDRPPRSTATNRRRPNAASSPPGTAPAGTPAAATAPGGPISTTSSRTPAAAPPPARTSAACAAAITGSRPTPAAGASG
jgi:hypothetical protein